MHRMSMGKRQKFPYLTHTLHLIYIICSYIYYTHVCVLFCTAHSVVIRGGSADIVTDGKHYVGLSLLQKLSHLIGRRVVLQPQIQYSKVLNVQSYYTYTCMHEP